MKSFIFGIIISLCLFLSINIYSQVREYDFMDKVGTSGYNNISNPGNYGSDKTDEDATSQTYVSVRYTNIDNGYAYRFYYSMPNNTTLGYQYAYAYFNRQSLTSTTTNNYLTAGTNLSFWFKSSSDIVGKTFKFTLKSSKLGPNSKNESYSIITNIDKWTNIVIPLSSLITAGNRNPFSITNIIGYSISVETVSTGTIYIDRVGFTDDPNPVSGSPDNVGVSLAPSGLNAQQISTNIKVRLTWNDLDNETSYTLFRNTSNDSNTATNIGGVTANVTVFTDTTVTTNVYYYYWIRAYSDYGYYYTGGVSDISTNSKFSNYSPTPFSSRAEVILSGSGSVSAPLYVNTYAVSSNNISVEWENVLNETSYTLFRATSNDTNSASAIAGLNSNVTQYNDTGLNELTTYYYWVKAYNSSMGKSSGFSSVSSARTFGIIEWTYMNKIGQTGYVSAGSPGNYGSDKEEDSNSQTTVDGNYINKSGSDYYYNLSYSIPTNTTLGYQYVYASFYYQSSSSSTEKNVTTWGTNLSIWLKLSDNRNVVIKLTSSPSNTTKYISEHTINVSTSWSNYIISTSLFTAVSGKQPVNLTKLINVSVTVDSVSSGDLYVSDIGFTDDPNPKSAEEMSSADTGGSETSINTITTNISYQQLLTPQADLTFDKNSFPEINNLISPEIYFYTTDGKLLKKLRIDEKWNADERKSINNFICIYKIVDNGKIIKKGIIVLAK